MSKHYRVSPATALHRKHCYCCDQQSLGATELQKMENAPPPLMRRASSPYYIALCIYSLLARQHPPAVFPRWNRAASAPASVLPSAATACASYVFPPPAGEKNMVPVKFGRFRNSGRVSNTQAASHGGVTYCCVALAQHLPCTAPKQRATFAWERYALLTLCVLVGFVGSSHSCTP